MPNWCSNGLTLNGPKNKIDQFINDFKGYEVNWDAKNQDVSEKNFVINYCLNAIYPVPLDVVERGFWIDSDILEKRSDPNKCDGYTWCIDNWGTKWDIDDVTFNSDNDFGFETAWGPPTGWVKYASLQYPEIEFELTYHEPGVGFAGIIKLLNGETTLEKDYEYGTKDYKDFVSEYFCWDFEDEENRGEE